MDSPSAYPLEDLDRWDDQRLPGPHVRVASAALRRAERMGPQWRRTAGRLGIGGTTQITVIADGAKWIWKEVATHLPGSAGVLDIYHASEHLHAAAVARHGEGTAASRSWFRQLRRILLERGASGVLQELETAAEERTGLAGYLRPHGDHTAYRERLAEGRSIGSGMVEGACKTAIGRRLKQTGARWRIRRLERMAALCCLSYSNQLDDYWRQAAG